MHRQTEVTLSGKKYLKLIAGGFEHILPVPDGAAKLLLDENFDTRRTHIYWYTASGDKVGVCESIPAEWPTQSSTT